MNFWQSPYFWSSKLKCSFKFSCEVLALWNQAVFSCDCSMWITFTALIVKFFNILQANHPTFEENYLQLLALTGVSQVLREGYSWSLTVVRFQSSLLQRKHMLNDCQAEWLSFLTVDKAKGPRVFNLFGKNNRKSERPSVIKHSVYRKCVLSSQVPWSLPPLKQKNEDRQCPSICFATCHSEKSFSSSLSLRKFITIVSVLASILN